MKTGDESKVANSGAQTLVSLMAQCFRMGDGEYPVQLTYFENNAGEGTFNAMYEPAMNSIIFASSPDPLDAAAQLVLLMEADRDRRQALLDAAKEVSEKGETQ